MKRDLKLLTVEVEKKLGKKIKGGTDFEKLSELLGKHHVKLNASALHKVWGYVTGKEKPSKETLDRLALFTGFQSWDDFHHALHGDDDGQVNYETE